MDHNPTSTTTNPTRSEAERLLGLADKLLHTHDLSGSREFAHLALESDSSLDGPHQILAISDVLLASEKRVNNNRQPDWYSILQTDPRSEPELLRKNYRRLALLLHPDKNNYPLADSAFKLVADAWAVLSDPSKRTPYDHELPLYSKVDLRPVDKDKLPVRRSPRAGGVGVAPPSDATPPPHAVSGMMNKNHPPPHPPNPNIHHSRGAEGMGNGNGNGIGMGNGNGERVPSFWTACPYCYVIYEYARVYKDYCVRCQNCDRSFQAAAIPSMPPMVPGKEAYYCCWGFFPIGFSVESEGKERKNVQVVDDNKHANQAAAGVPVNDCDNDNNNPNAIFPNWMPGMFTTPMGGGAQVNMNNVPNVNVSMNDGAKVVDFTGGNASTGFVNAMPGMSAPGPKKRGRPRKNPLGA